jgi:ABC-type lipoprotein release transport system permease subunit
VSYRSTLVTKWSTRDRLAVVGIALATALVVGSALLLTAAGMQVTQIAAEAQGNASATYYDSVPEARASATGEDVVVPVATARTNGREVTVAGVPPGIDFGTRIGERSLSGTRAPPPGVVYGSDRDGTETEPNRTVRLAGRANAIGRQLRPDDGGSVFPAGWYVARPAAVERLGPRGALVFEEERTDARRRQVSLVSALPFFRLGTGELLAALRPLALAAAVLSAVVVFSVTRMTVRDRLSTIHVLRATGATRRTVVATFAFRGALVAAVGVAVGFAVGTILTRGAVTLAAYVGLLTTLDPLHTPGTVGLLGAQFAVLVAVGGVAGAVATRIAVTRSPADLRRAAGGDTGARIPRTSRGGERSREGRLERARAAVDRVLAWFRPALLDRRAAVPTAVTLSVFVTAALIVAAVGAAFAPLAASDGAIVDRAAAHPVNSRLDAGYATALRSSGVRASPEIVLFEVVGDRPFLARGANFTAFAGVTGADLVAGRAPQRRGEAVVGADLARTLGVDVGETLLLGGSNRPRVTRVRVVGRYRAPGFRDDQLIVPVRTARHLSNVGPGRVNLIRVDRRPAARTQDRNAGENATPAPTSGESSLVVTNLSVPDSVRTGEQFRVRVTVRNLAASRENESVAVAVGNVTRSRRVEVAPEARTQFAVRFGMETPGTFEVRAGDLVRQISVDARSSLRVAALPDRAPPDATLLVPVTGPDGQPATNATVAVGPVTAAVDESGVAGVDLPPSGEYAVRATAANRTGVAREVTVERGTRRRLLVDVRVVPNRPTPLTRPTVGVTATNRWAGRLERAVTVEAGDETHRRRVALDPGERRTLQVRIPRAGPGRHEVAVETGGRVAATRTYVVQGDRRIASALSTGGDYSPGASIGRGIASALGNLQILLATFLALAALATVGTVTAGFGAAVHARRKTIGIARATGATRTGVLRTVLVDAARVSGMAVPPALAAGYLGAYLLGEAGLLTVFGVRMAPERATLVLAGSGVVAFVLALLGAALATVPLLRAPPARLLALGAGSDEPGGDASGGSDARSPARGDGDTLDPATDREGGKRDA